MKNKTNKENRSIITGIKITIRTAQSQFKNIGSLDMRNSEKLVEARGSLIRAERKLNAVLKDIGE